MFLHNGSKIRLPRHGCHARYGAERSSEFDTLQWVYGKSCAYKKIDRYSNGIIYR
uniref:Uncharacterized protein n=1 Tax=Romanomermis culicivorax TaxID=13658 RepID=A0A915HTY9_ROMCU